MDVSQALKDTENALRDFIADVLEAKFGHEWPGKCGLTPERIAQWEERKATEARRQKAGAVDERLIYYADFYDLKTLLLKNWNVCAPFSEALGNKQTMEVWLSEMEILRDPAAHNRELLPHQKHLALGIAGEIRTRLVRYRSKQETSEGYFPQIEIVRDNYGNVWTGPSSTPVTHTLLRPGDILEFVVTASDPMGEELEYALDYPSHSDYLWQKSNVLSLRITDQLIGRSVVICPCIRSLRSYHAYEDHDDAVSCEYDILPSKTVQG